VTEALKGLIMVDSRVGRVSGNPPMPSWDLGFLPPDIFGI